MIEKTSKMYYQFINLYMGKVYIISSRFNDNIIIPDVGQYVSMFINENDPEEFYVETKEFLPKISLVGCAFVGFPLLMILNNIVLLLGYL